MADFKHRGGSFIKAEQRLKTQASAVYHEALVHPALFTHSNPKRVSIIGGAEAGGALREVLKHNTIEEAVMIVIDRKGVNLSREDLPEWGGFSNLIGSDSLCVQDPRATIYNEDPSAWFVNRYGDSEKCNTEKMDAIIMDAV
jgi:spermidine synthase